MAKSYEEINEKIRKGEAVVVTAEEMMEIVEERGVRRAVRDDQIFAPVVDYSRDYPQTTGNVIGEVSYGELRSGAIKLRGKAVPTASTSSYALSREIAEVLSEWIRKRKFFLSKPGAPTPSAGAGIRLRGLKVRHSD